MWDLYQGLYQGPSDPEANEKPMSHRASLFFIKSLHIYEYIYYECNFPKMSNVTEKVLVDIYLASGSPFTNPCLGDPNRNFFL